jgi:hypothetical protein
LTSSKWVRCKEANNAAHEKYPNVSADMDFTLMEENASRSFDNTVVHQLTSILSDMVTASAAATSTISTPLDSLDRLDMLRLLMDSYFGSKVEK